MTISTRASTLAATLAIVALASCGRDDRGEPQSRRSGRALAEVAAGDPPVRPDVGQVIYVPAYSSILIQERAREFRLSVMLSIRNLDRDRPIVVQSVRYHDQDGALVRDFLKAPLRLGPLAATEFFIPENDTLGGVSACFLVEWGASGPVASPIVEAIMTGTASNQGIAFACPGRVLADKTRPGPMP